MSWTCAHIYIYIFICFFTRDFHCMAVSGPLMGTMLAHFRLQLTHFGCHLADLGWLLVQKRCPLEIPTWVFGNRDFQGTQVGIFGERFWSHLAHSGSQLAHSGSQLGHFGSQLGHFGCHLVDLGWLLEQKRCPLSVPKGDKNNEKCISHLFGVVLGAPSRL